MLVFAEIVLVVLWLRLIVLTALGVLAWSRHRARNKLVVPSGRVSVIIPAFNEEDSIEDTLSSLTQHDPVPWEIIVVNDGSTDLTGEISGKYLEGVDRGRVINLSFNRGKAEALNIGILAATGDYIATIDADTRLQPGALSTALSIMANRDADAVAFYLEVCNRTTILGRLQQQEYIASMNFERAGQDIIGAISVLPGAASLFRRDVLVHQSFSSRTRTEDADLTLELARRGISSVLAANAVASTIVPGTVADLFAQRVRWTMGHLQCCYQHAFRGDGANRRFRFAVFPNFVISTLSTVLSLTVVITVWAEGQTFILELDWFDVSAISLFLTYCQRAWVWILDDKRRASFGLFLLEPFVTGLVGMWSFFCALYSLCATDA